MIPVVEAQAELHTRWEELSPYGVQVRADLVYGEGSEYGQRLVANRALQIQMAKQV